MADINAIVFDHMPIGLRAGHMTRVNNALCSWMPAEGRRSRESIDREAGIRRRTIAVLKSTIADAEHRLRRQREHQAHDIDITLDDFEHKSMAEALGPWYRRLP